MFLVAYRSGQTKEKYVSRVYMKIETSVNLRETLRQSYLSSYIVVATEKFFVYGWANVLSCTQKLLDSLVRSLCSLMPRPPPSHEERVW